MPKPLEISKIKVAAQTENHAAMTDPVKKEETEKKALDEKLQGGLRGNKANQEAAKADLIKKYEEEIGLSHRKAKKYAKLELQNKIAQEKVENTTVFMDKAAYKDAKAENKDNKFVNITYVRNKKVRELVEAEPERFTGENGFSSDSYKNRVKEFTGTDYKQNLDERHVTAKKNGISKRAAKKMAKYGGYETEKDLTWLKRAGITAGGAALGAPLGAGVGYAVMGSTTVTALLNQMVNVVYPDKNEIFEDHKKEEFEHSNKKDGAAVGAYSGAAAGAAGAAFGSAFTKDNGGKDIFNGINIRAFVEEGTRGVRGKDNEKILAKGIDVLKGKGYNTDDIVKCVQIGVAEKTNGKANERELIAFYEAAKLMPVKPEEKKKDCDCDEDKKVDKKDLQDKINMGNEIKLEPKKDEKFGDVDIEKVVKQEIKGEYHTWGKGEIWWNIVKAKYHLADAKEIREAVRLVKAANNLKPEDNKNPNKALMPSELNLSGRKEPVKYDKTAAVEKVEIKQSDWKPSVAVGGTKTKETSYKGTITRPDGTKEEIRATNLNKIIEKAKEAKVPTDKLNQEVNKVIQE